MNHLYEAIVGLGRSWDSIRRGEWKTAGLGRTGTGEPKCAIGHLSYTIFGSPTYLTVWADPDRSDAARLADRNKVMWLMADALRKCVTPEMYEHAVARTHIDFGSPGSFGVCSKANTILQSMAAAMNGSVELREVQLLIVRVNDSFHDNAQAARWFSDAIDLLVDELLPAMPNYHYCKACQQGLGWDGVTEHVDGCPDKALTLV